MAGKRTTEIAKGIDRKKLYELGEAVKMVKSRAKAKFDETVEVAMNLGVDPRHADQMVRGVVNLPKGTGKDVRVAVFALAPPAEFRLRVSCSFLSRSTSGRFQLFSRTNAVDG